MIMPTLDGACQPDSAVLWSSGSLLTIGVSIVYPAACHLKLRGVRHPCLTYNDRACVSLSWWPLDHRMTTACAVCRTGRAPS